MPDPNPPAPPSDPPKPADPPPADPKPADPPKPDPDKELGFPKDTPVAEMTDKQAAAYWKHHARKHEGRLKDLAGDRKVDDVKADLDELAKLKQEKLTPSEQALAKAKAEARAEAAQQMAPKLVGMAFDAALAHVDEDARRDLIDNLNLSNFIDSNGDVDTDKVKTVAKTIAPAGKDKGRRYDYGGGNRDNRPTSGVAAGAERFAERHKKTPSSKE